MIARGLLPASPSYLLDRQDRAITSARPRSVSRHVGRTRRRNHDGGATRTAPTGAGLHLIVDSTGLSIVGEGEWAAAKHGGRGRRGWKKLHFGVDRSGVIVARALTEASVDDATTGITLIEAVDGALGQVTADAAYDTIGFYEAAEPHGDIASLDQRSVVCRPIPDVVFCLVLWVHSRLHVEIMHLLSPRWPGGRSWLTEGAGSVHQRVCRESPVKGDKMP